MTNTIEQLQVLYEIAMSIGSSLDLRPMLKNSLALLLKKLTCSAGGVLFFRSGPISSLALNVLQEIHFEEVFTIPRSIAYNKAYQAAIRRIPKTIPVDRLDVFFQQLPLSGQEDSGSNFYILELPDIGLLILTKYGEGLDPVIFKSLKILSDKLAGACKACLQNAALRESEEKFRSLFENIQDVYFETLMDGTILEISPSIEFISKGQYKQADLMGKSMYEFYPDTKERNIIIEKMQKTGSVADFEVQLKNRDGLGVPCSISAKMVLNAEGRPEKIIGSMHDISERKRAEEALRENEEKYRYMFANNPQPMWIYDLETLAFLEINNAAIHHYGYTREEFLSMTLNDIRPKKDIDALLKDVELTQQVYNPAGEWRYLKKNGEIINVEINSHSITFKDRKARHVIISDITERKRGEEKLKKLSSVVENATDHVFITDYDGVIEYVNPAFERLTGYTKDDAIGKTPRILKSGKKTQDEYRQLWETVRAGNIFQGMVINRKKNGDLYYEEKIITPLRDEHGNITHFVSTGRDVTERIQAEEIIANEKLLSESIINSLPGVFYIIDAEGKFLRWNKNFETISGRSSAEIATLHPLDLFAGEEKQVITQKIQQVFTTGNADVEGCLVSKSGLETPFFFSGMRIVFDNRPCLIGIGLDITERKRAEEAILKERTLLKTLIDNLPVGVFVKDKEYRKIIVNQIHSKEVVGHLKYLGVNSVIDILGKTDFEVFPKEMAENYFIEDQKVIRDGSLILNTEGFGYNEDGDQLWLLVSKIPLRDNDGKINGMVGVTTDITERRRAEEELRASEKRYRELFENNPQPMWVSDKITFSFHAVNEAAVKHYGYSREEFLSMTIQDIHPPDLLGALSETVSKRMDLLRKVGVWQHRKKDGSLIDVEITMQDVDFIGRPARLVIVHDITERKRAEEQIESLSRFPSENPNPVLRVEMDGKIIYANPASESLLRLWNCAVHGYLPPEWRERIVNTARNSVMTTVEVEYEERVYSIMVVPISALGYVNLYGRDITKRKRAEDALRETTDYLDNLLSFANAPIIVWDNNNWITKFNLAFERLTKYTIYDVVGKHPGILFPDERREDFSALITRTTDGENLISVEMPVRCKDGSTRIVLWNTANIYSSDVKTIIATIALGQDITERKQAEEELQASELRFRSLYENATIGIYRTTPDGNILLANPALVEMLGYTSFQELAERNLEKDGFEPSYQRKEFLEKIEKDGEINGYDSKWICQDGTAIFVLESARAIRDSQGKTLYYDGTIEDITNYRQLEEQMRQMQKLESLGALAGGIAHDFNNILGIILVYVTVLDRMKNDPEKLQRAIKTISTAVQRGAALVRQILTFARKSDTEFGAVLINDIAKEVVEMIRETFPRTLTYSQNLQKGIPAINADRSQVHQAILNLCVNARDAMPDGGEITMNTSTVDGVTLHTQHPDALASTYIRIEVVDTGTGMTEEIRNRIFEPFFTTKEKGKGTGLGLAVVFGIVQTHKGFVDVSSELGKGTIFRLYFPVPPVILPVHESTKVIVEEIPGGTETLLVVEDEETLMTFLQIGIAAKGYTVLSAIDGPEAVKTYRERHKEISMVFTDLGLPGMTGMEEINIIKKINPDVKIIVATGFLDPEMKSELLKAGVKKFIFKPYNFEEILILLRDVLDEK